MAELDESNNIVRSAAPVTVVSTDLAVLTASLVPGAVGRAYAGRLAAAGGDGTYRFEVTGLPAGLTADGATISGIPTESGRFEVGVTVQSDGRMASTQLQLAVGGDGLRLMAIDGPLPEAAVGEDYLATFLAIGGEPPYRWTARSGGLPPGLTLDTERHAFRNLTASRRLSIRDNGY